jgi:hypothetical protein
MGTMPTEDGVKFDSHVPEVKVQVAGWNSPPLLLEKVTKPVGDKPATLALQGVGTPMVTGCDEQATVTLEFNFKTDNEKVPLMGWLLESPPYRAVMVTGDTALVGV